MTISKEDAMVLEAQVLAFEKRFLAENADAADRDYYATLVLNLRSLSRLLDKRFSLNMEKGK